MREFEFKKETFIHKALENHLAQQKSSSYLIIFSTMHNLYCFISSWCEKTFSKFPLKIGEKEKYFAHFSLQHVKIYHKTHLS